MFKRGHLPRTLAFWLSTSSVVRIGAVANGRRSQDMGLSWRLTAGLSPIALFFPSANLLHLLNKTSLIEFSRLGGSVKGLLFRQGVLCFEVKLEQHDHCYDDRATHERYLLLQIGASGIGWKQNMRQSIPTKATINTILVKPNIHGIGLFATSVPRSLNVEERQTSGT